jgi:hypothetical protein
MKHFSFLFFLCLALLPSRHVHAQPGRPAVQLDLSAVDGIELSPFNIFNYRIDNRSQQSQQVTVTGRIQFRRSQLGFSYQFNVLLQPGINNMSEKDHHPRWTFSDNALRELFQKYSKLPQGTYEYCVSVQQNAGGESNAAAQPDACVYNTVNDIFLINLVSPENDAKLHEQNPMLSWTVNYHFAQELNYRLRVVELKKGQTPATAITRNNPVYQDNHVMTTGTIYPVTARPLEKWQPYAWTVDAYYKGILLGGAEAWKFTIVDDSLLKGGPAETFYVDIRQEHNNASYYAVGRLKLKYVLDERPEDPLKIVLRNAKGKIVRLQQQGLQAILGDNRFEIDLEQQADLKHKMHYTLELTNSAGTLYTLPFIYINPALAR